MPMSSTFFRAKYINPLVGPLYTIRPYIFVQTIRIKNVEIHSLKHHWFQVFKM